MLWKIWEDDFTDAVQESMLQQAIENKEYLYLLGTKEWKIPVHTYNIKVTTATKTKIDILKKMVMYTFLNMKIIDLKELSSSLRVELLFINDVVEQMEITGVVENEDGIYKLTEVGKEQFEAGTILSDPSIENLKFEYSLLNKNPIKEESSNKLIQEDWELEKYRYLEDEDDLENIVLEENTLRKIIQEIGEVFEVGGNEKIISKIEPTKLVKENFAKCVEYQLYDLLENKVYARIWNGALSRWDESLENYITEVEGPTWKANYDRDIIENFPERYEYLKEKLKNFNNVKNKQKPLDILRGKDIRQRFINSFAETKRKMLMVSPWISSSVVDKEMIMKLKDFAKKGKTLYISWGISKNLNREDRKPEQALIDTLKEIVHEDGTQAIFVRWFGNQHNKEIVVDDRTHLLGSFNWLSYRGENDIRHESVVVIKEEKVIKDTVSYIEEKFINALKKELDIILSSEYEKNQLDDKIVKNWMKELIIMDSVFEERKVLSDQLMNFLQKNNNDDLIHDLACMWARYNAESFGSRLHLANLLKKNEETKAKAYLALCQQYLKNSPIVEWSKSPELVDYKDWVLANLVKSNNKKKTTHVQSNKNVHRRKK